MKNKKVLFAIVSLTILVCGIIIGLLLVNQNQDIREKAAPATSIYVVPKIQTKSHGMNFTFDVVLDSSLNKITGVDIRLKFDPDELEIISLSKGSGLLNLDSTIANTFDNTSGKISFAVYTTNKNNAVGGSDIIAFTVNGKVKDLNQQGFATISFEDTTSASGILENQDIIVNRIPGKIIDSTLINDGQPRETQPSSVNVNLPNTPIAGVTKQSQATAVVQSNIPLPETGNTGPTLIGIGIGLLVILSSLILVF